MENNNALMQRVFKVVIPLVAILAIAAAGYFYKELRTLKNDPQAAAKQETADLVARVGRLVVLPTGEDPTVATVSDPEALKDQAFFAQAQAGDKVLIYAQAKKAILYSVTLNKIIEVAPLNIGAGQKAVTPPKPDTTTSPN